MCSPRPSTTLAELIMPMAIKCDRRKPKCRTCENSSRQCMGYDEHVKGIFVNINTENIKEAKKAIISEATRSYRDSHDLYQEAEAGYRTVTTTSIHTLDLSPGEFRQHFLTLWSHFQVAYAKTPGSWVVQLSHLTLCNKTLDMALVSLATMRLSLCGQRERYQILSLATYHESIRLFQRILQKDTKKPHPILVIISLMFTLFEAAQQRPSQICHSGWSGHLKGALGLMQRQGPRKFQKGGFHFAFKKIREMAVRISHGVFDLMLMIARFCSRFRRKRHLSWRSGIGSTPRGPQWKRTHAIVCSI